MRNLAAKAGTGTGRASDPHLLVMAGLTIADELSDAYEKLRRGGGAADGERAARALEGMAERLEGIAVRLENL